MSQIPAHPVPPEDEAINNLPIRVVDDVFQLAEKRVARLQKFIALSLQITAKADWVNFDGKAYLQGSGAEKVARLFGVCWTAPQIECIEESDAKGAYYRFTATASFYLSTNPAEAIGIVGKCSSRDKFFGTKNQELKPLEDVDKGNIQAKAVTNLINNGIKRLLGLRNIPWEMVAKAGIAAADVPSVDFKQGKQGGTSRQTAAADKVARLKQLLIALRPGSPQAQAALFHEVADIPANTDKSGKSWPAKLAPPPDRMSEKWLATTTRTLETMCEKEGINPDARQPVEAEPAQPQEPAPADDAQQESYGPGDDNVPF